MQLVRSRRCFSRFNSRRMCKNDLFILKPNPNNVVMSGNCVIFSWLYMWPETDIHHAVNLEEIICNDYFWAEQEAMTAWKTRLSITRGSRPRVGWASVYSLVHRPVIRCLFVIQEEAAKPKNLCSQRLSPKWCFLDCKYYLIIVVFTFILIITQYDDIMVTSCFMSMTYT